MSGDSVRLPVKVVPGSSRNCIAGWLDQTLRVRVTAPPERGKANSAVEKFITEALGLPAGSVRIIKGTSSPRKVIEIAGLAEPEVHSLLSKAAHEP